MCLACSSAKLFSRPSSASTASHEEIILSRPVHLERQRVLQWNPTAAYETQSVLLSPIIVFMMMNKKFLNLYWKLIKHYTNFKTFHMVIKISVLFIGQNKITILISSLVGILEEIITFFQSNEESHKDTSYVNWCWRKEDILPYFSVISGFRAVYYFLTKPEMQKLNHIIIKGTIVKGRKKLIFFQQIVSVVFRMGEGRKKQES